MIIFARSFFFFFLVARFYADFDLIQGWDVFFSFIFSFLPWLAFGYSFSSIYFTYMLVSCGVLAIFIFIFFLAKYFAVRDWFWVMIFGRWCCRRFMMGYFFYFYLSSLFFPPSPQIDILIDLTNFFFPTRRLCKSSTCYQHPATFYLICFILFLFCFVQRLLLYFYI